MVAHDRLVRLGPALAETFELRPAPPPDASARRSRLPASAPIQPPERGGGADRPSERTRPRSCSCPERKARIFLPMAKKKGPVAQAAWIALHRAWTNRDPRAGVSGGSARRTRRGKRGMPTVQQVVSPTGARLRRKGSIFSHRSARGPLPPLPPPSLGVFFLALPIVVSGPSPHFRDDGPSFCVGCERSLPHRSPLSSASSRHCQHLVAFVNGPSPHSAMTALILCGVRRGRFQPLPLSSASFSPLPASSLHS